mgnify:CR=1 FL=1
MTERLKNIKEQPFRYAAFFGLLAVFATIISLRLPSYFDADQFNEEVRILYHLDRSKLQQNDYSGNFLKQLPQPIAYEGLTKSALAVGIDLPTFHRVLGGACFLVFLAGMFVASLRVGLLFALIVASFSATQIVFFQQTSSATPHAFAFPLLSWMLVALVYDRLWLGGVLAFLASLLYIPMAPTLGLMFAYHALFLPNTHSEPAHPWYLSATIVGLVGLISIAFVSQQLQPIDGYGQPIQPGQHIERYPENGLQGRYHISVFSPVYHFVSTALGQFHESVPPALAFGLLALMLVFSALGLYNLRSEPSAFRSFSVFLVTSFLCFGLVFVIRPYVSYRFLLYPLFTALPFLFVYGIVNLISRAEKLSKLIQLAIASILIFVGISMGAAEHNQTNRRLSLTQSDREMLDFVTTLPANSLIAAWPNREAASLIPYITGRPLFVDYKAHYPSYEEYLLQMRERMFSLIDAHLAASVDPLQTLMCRWGVDYMLIEPSMLRQRSGHFSYFEPFNRRISDRIARLSGKRNIFFSLPESASVFTSKKYVIFDLRSITNVSDCEDVAKKSARLVDFFSEPGLALGNRNESASASKLKSKMQPANGITLASYFGGVRQAKRDRGAEGQVADSWPPGAWR